MSQDPPAASPPPGAPAGTGTPEGHLSDRDRALLRQAEDGRLGARLLVRLLEGFLTRLSRDLTLQAAQRDELQQGPVGDAALYTHELRERIAELSVDLERAEGRRGRSGLDPESTGSEGIEL